ncbi:peptidase inhibitor family I36 protein [Streptomyces clavifer]|uniref:peptidase inhibitor family I36 protein n=1 Tax=Streptomyces clavifer TaxID=68188 RepID=UPI0036764132
MAGGSLATAAPASATGGCSAGTLCVYSKVDFGGYKITSTSTNTCFRLNSVTPNFGYYVQSYVNNLSVDAHTYSSVSNNWVKRRTLVSGGFSSEVPLYSVIMVCIGGANPENY